jgi:hypothetical protein
LVSKSVTGHLWPLWVITSRRVYHQAIGWKRPQAALDRDLM